MVVLVLNASLDGPWKILYSIVRLMIYALARSLRTCTPNRLFLKRFVTRTELRWSKQPAGRSYVTVGETFHTGFNRDRVELSGHPTHIYLGGSANFSDITIFQLPFPLVFGDYRSYSNP